MRNGSLPNHTFRGKSASSSIFSLNFIFLREENCVARGETALLELTVRQFEFIRHVLAESKHQKDLTIFESQLKRSYQVKKSERLYCFK